MKPQITAAALAVLLLGTPAFAGDYYYGPRPLRYGTTSGWHFDARDDQRDFTSNGVFPGNFAANPPLASIGSAGFLESNPYRSALPYPSQVYFRPTPDRTICAHRYRSYDPASGTYRGHDGLRHRCILSARY